MGFVQLRNIFFREVHPRGQMSLQGGEGILLLPDLLGQRTGQGRIGQRDPLPPVRRDQIHDRLRLGQAQLAVQECAAGVLTGRGGLGTGRETGFYQTTGDGIAAVTGKLHHVLAGVAVGCPEEQGHALVEHFPALHEMAEQGCVALGVPHRFGRTGRTEHLFRHGIALPAGQAHHRDASGTRGGGNGCNGRFLHDGYPFSVPVGPGHRNALLSAGSEMPPVGFILPRNPAE